VLAIVVAVTCMVRVTRNWKLKKGAQNA